MIIKRTLQKQIEKDLESKMVFLVGPRQVGKTFLAKIIMQKYKNPLYLNYDNMEHRAIMKDQNWSSRIDLIVFDEIHKMKQWKNYIKGVYDTKTNNVHILVTGSARMNYMRKAGDSLAGRYFIHHLFPLTVSEFRQNRNNVLNQLFEKGGFPDPYIGDSENAKRWRNLYHESMLREDILSFNNVDKINELRNIYTILKTKVGSTISYINIARDIGVSSVTVKKYILLLEALYIIFIIKPYSKKISRSILKEPKIYFYDHCVVENLGARFENLIALHLLSSLSYRKDSKGENVELGFLRTKEHKESDFVLAKDGEIELIVETKLNDRHISKELIYFSEKYSKPAIQVVYELIIEKNVSDMIHIRNAENFLGEL